MRTTKHQPEPAQSTLHDYIPYLNAKLDWLRRHGATFEDVEATILGGLHASGGMTPQDIVRYTLEAMHMPKDDSEHVYDVCTAMLDRGDLRQNGTRRLEAARPEPDPRVIALVSVPLHEWASLQRYAYRARAAWIAGEHDRA